MSERQRKRADVAKVYRAYIKLVQTRTAEAAHQRAVLLRLLMRVTHEPDSHKALAAGRRAANVKRKRSPAIPAGAIPVSGLRTAPFHGRGPRRITSVVVNIDTDGAAGSETATLTGTDWHPVWEPKLRAWVPLANLQAGSWLQTSSGTWVQVTTVRRYHGTGKVHDLTVAGAHNYHVVTGGAAALVHNCGPDSPVDPSGEATVYLDNDKLHASIEVRHGGESLHTERIGMTPGGPTAIREFQGPLSANTDAIRIPLPNAQAAKAAQEGMRGFAGKYDPKGRNCVTHCGEVLWAGGRADVPIESTAIVSWLRNTDF